MSLEIRLKKPSKVYREGETVKGSVAVVTKDPLSHSGLFLAMEGTVNLQLSAKSVGMFEAFYKSLKPVQLVNYSLELCKPGKFPSGTTEVPFELPLKPRTGKTLYETYQWSLCEHHVFPSSWYEALHSSPKTCRSHPNSSSSTTKAHPRLRTSRWSSPFLPSHWPMSRRRASVPDFLVSGKIDTVNCCITKPFTGELTVDHCQAPIRSIELQLVRVETCGCAEGYARDPTEIQNIQIADGDVCRGSTIPIFMIFLTALYLSNTYHFNFQDRIWGEHCHSVSGWSLGYRELSDHLDQVLTCVHMCVCVYLFGILCVCVNVWDIQILNFLQYMYFVLYLY